MSDPTSEPEGTPFLETDSLDSDIIIIDEPGDTTVRPRPPDIPLDPPRPRPQQPGPPAGPPGSS
jgi:hypothetical protein